MFPRLSGFLSWLSGMQIGRPYGLRAPCILTFFAFANGPRPLEGIDQGRCPWRLSSFPFVFARFCCHSQARFSLSSLDDEVCRNKNKKQERKHAERGVVAHGPELCFGNLSFGGGQAEIGNEQRMSFSCRRELRMRNKRLRIALPLSESDSDVEEARKMEERFSSFILRCQLSPMRVAHGSRGSAAERKKKKREKNKKK